MAKQNFKKVHEACLAAGRAAAEATVPRGMVVRDSRTGQTWDVPDGPCGFAWIKFPGNTAWGRWAAQNGIASSAYPTGKQIWVHDYNQSIQLKEAHARAYAAKLNELIPNARAVPGSRMD